MFFKKKENTMTAMTTGQVTGVSAVQVNNRHLPLVDYYVNGAKYTVLMPVDIMKQLEQAAENPAQVVRANMNFGTSFSGQKTKLMGMNVPVYYDPTNPKKGEIRWN